jgi:hypothetical protein
MARLRAFKANGGNVYDFMKEQKKEKKLYDITTRLLKETKKKLKQKKTAEIVFCKPKFLTFAKLFPQAPVGNFYVNPNSFD